MMKKLVVILLVWMFFPLVSVATVFGYFIAWAFYLLHAQTDAPLNQPMVPLSPWRVCSVAFYVLHNLYENVTGPFVPSMLQYFWHKLSSGKRRVSVRKNIRYGQRPRNFLDVYLPDRVSKGFKENRLHPTNVSLPNSTQTERPVIILLCTSWNSGNKSTCMPLAHNLQSQGYAVVVPDITLYPKGKIAEMVSDVQHVICWTHTHIRQFRGDSSQIYLMGYSAGALLAALTVAHDACANLNVIPHNTTPVNIPVWDSTKRTALPRIQGLILFSGDYDVTYYYAYLHHKGLEQVHAMPRVMGNTPETFLQCSPTFLLNHALSRVKNRDQLKKALPSKVVLIHGAKDPFSPQTSTKNFFDLLDSCGIPSVQLKIYEDERHINPRIDLIVPTRRLCVLLLEDIEECCTDNTDVVTTGGTLKEKRVENNHGRIHAIPAATNPRPVFVTA